MTLQRAAQSRAGIPETDLRRSCLGESRDEFGLCLCGDADDRYLPCDHAAILARRRHTASEAPLSAAEARLAWLIVAKVEH